MVMQWSQGSRLGGKSMAAALRYKTLNQTEPNITIYTCITPFFICTSHTEVFRSVFAGFVRIVDPGVRSVLG